MAEADIRVLDLRIAARFRNPRPSDVIVASVRPLSWVLGQVAGALGAGNRLRRLSVCCHGYETILSDTKAMMSRVGGGFGLQLGSEDLTFGTVGQFSALNGRFSPGGTLDVYACSAADDSSGVMGGFTGNGRALMRELAGHVGATVRASDAPQLYNAGVVQHSVLGLFSYTTYEGADFGEWEGNVWQFLPDGSRRRDAAPGRGVS